MRTLDRYLASAEGAIVKNATPTSRAIPFEPRPDDIIIAGHAKSGTTWMQQILHQLRTKGDENFKEIYEIVPYLPEYNMKTNMDPVADQVANPRVFKSHALFETIPNLEGKTKFVVTIRDPYDTEFSLTKFLFRFWRADEDVGSDDYLTIAKNPIVPDFASFITSWYPQRHNPNVLLIPYEDLKHDSGACIQKIAKFAFGEPLQEPEFSKILHLCSFDYMSQHRDKFTGDQLACFGEEKGNVESRSVIGGLVRLDGGKIGQGNKMLDENIRQYIDKRWKETVERELGIKTYRELFDKCTHFGDNMKVKEG